MDTLPKHLDEILDEHDSEEPLPRKKREDDEMDITPMIDITFLLLIFFLVTSTPDESTSVELPDAQHGAAVSQLSSTVFTIAEGGLEGAPVYEADGKVESMRLPDDPALQKKQIQEAVEKGLNEDNKSDVIIKADKNVKCREIDRVMKAISKVAGIKIHMAILTKR